MTQRSEISLGLRAIETSLRGKIKLYKKRALEIERYLSKRPEEWGIFQAEFNEEINSIFKEIMDFEKLNLANGTIEKVEKLKKIFIKKIRNVFVRKGSYVEWSLKKPYGYAGDFKIIDDIYQNNPTLTGFDRLFDNYFQMSAISVAVRNRKEDFKRILIDFIRAKKKSNVKILNLASGSCRELKELMAFSSAIFKKAVFDCCDNEKDSVSYAKKLLGDLGNVNFVVDNALRIAGTKNIESRIKGKYDLIYSMGLFDYLNYKVSVRLVTNLKRVLKKKGVLVIADVRDKFSNSSVHFMEWVGDWNLIYRSNREFKQIFLDAGFNRSDLQISYEQQGVMQYIIAKNNE